MISSQLGLSAYLTKFGGLGRFCSLSLGSRDWYHSGNGQCSIAVGYRIPYCLQVVVGLVEARQDLYPGSSAQRTTWAQGVLVGSVDD